MSPRSNPQPCAIMHQMIDEQEPRVNIWIDLGEFDDVLLRPSRSARPLSIRFLPIRRPKLPGCSAPLCISTQLSENTGPTMINPKNHRTDPRGVHRNDLRRYPRRERDAVYDRLRRAVLVSFFALTFTGMTVASAVFDRTTDEPRAAIELTSVGIKAMKAACGSLPRLNDLRVQRSTVDDDVIVIDLPVKSCCGQASELALPRGEIAAIVLR